MPVVCIERPAKILKDGSSTIVQRSMSSQSLGGEWQQSCCIYRFVIVVAVETLPHVSLGAKWLVVQSRADSSAPPS